jgi:hypothetical protein
VFPEKPHPGRLIPQPPPWQVGPPDSSLAPQLAVPTLLAVSNPPQLNPTAPARKEIVSHQVPLQHPKGVGKSGQTHDQVLWDTKSSEF